MDSDIPQAYLGDGPGERTLWLALGYMEAAAFLCKALVEDDFTRQYRSTRVVLQLTHHAIELFFKGAITAATGKAAPRTHKIDALQTAYQRNYPSVGYRFDLPFDVTKETTGDLFAEIAIPEAIPLAERFRYATRADGSCFDESDSFKPAERSAQLFELYGMMNVIFLRIRDSRVSK